MNRRLLIATIAALTLLAVPPAGASAQPGGSAFPIVFLSARTAAGRFQGTFEIRRFRVRGTGLAAFGRLRGTLRDRRDPSSQRLRNAPSSFDATAGRPAGATTCARVAINFAGRTAPLV